VNHPDAARERRDLILDLMERQGRIQVGEDAFYEIAPEELAAARETPVEIAVKRFPIEAPHFVLQYIQPQLEQLFGRDALFRDGLVVTTTLDLDLQFEANQRLEFRITDRAPGTTQSYEQVSNSSNGAVVVVDPKTGEILVMVGSRDYFREDIEGKNNNATALNSPGSAFKPFVYVTSFINLGWGPGTIILDTPVSIRQQDGTDFTPANPGRNFQGPITIRNALGNSLNIPPIKVAQQVGVDAVVSQAKKMGFTSLTGNYGPAIATGGVDLTPLDMAYGYSVFANGGIMRGQEPFAFNRHRAGERTVDPISILKVTDAQGRVRFDVEPMRKSERVVEEEYTYLISNILSDASAQCITFGCGGISVAGRQVAVKTGTSEPFDPRGPNAGRIGETWAFGYTPDVVVGIWAGNSDNSPIVNIYSTSISFRAMQDVLLGYYDGRPGAAFSRPAGIVEESVCVPSGLKPTPLCGRTTRDLFVKDKVPTQDDNWWQRLRIDARNGLLAAPNTPGQFVEERVMLVPPAELMKTDDDKKRMQEWAEALNLPLAPTETSNASGAGSNLPVLIFSPTAGAQVSGNVQITGRATSSRFESYTLEYGSGASPSSWRNIDQSTRQVDNGTLGVWSTTNLEPGIYTIRLVVEDRSGGNTTASTTVVVTAPGTATPAPGPR
jgi:membrane peptidoglycan carboxypeptidase